MKSRILSIVALLALVLSIIGCKGPTATVPTSTQNLDWWPTQAQPQPVEDPRADYMGRWWWPTDPAQEVSPLWGNRGYVYVLKWTKTEAEVPLELKTVVALELREVHFAFDKSELTPTAQTILQDAVAKLKKHPNAYVTIEGHTCSIGTEEYNMGLGTRRAESVKKFLISQGIEAERLTTISYGETRLKVSEREASDYSLNRRVEFDIEMR
jgi:outer membrane protein OmpA-like peptidoglycan-associated protein